VGGVMRVLVLGGYGFIGLEICRALATQEVDVIGLGRTPEHGRRALPQIGWIGADLAQLVTPEAWAPYLAGVDCVVNAAGALQDGARDDLAAVQQHAIIACVGACAKAGARRFVQISAPGVSASASTAFFRTKAAADAALKASSLDWVILRPALVFSRNAYGGTALLRTLAAAPLVQPLMFSAQAVQTVAMADVVEAVVMAVRGEAPAGTDADLAEDEPRTLGETVAALRAWLGFAPARWRFDAPRWVGYLIGRCADLAGWLGWRSPLRTTALRVMEEGVRADPALWRRITGRSLATLAQTLAANPATVQERVFARAQWILPIALMTLAGFWLASGLIGLARIEAAAGVLSGAMVSDAARAAVIAGALADIALGLGVLYRRTSRVACFGMIALTVAYLIAGTWLTPALWADPLGPFVKTLPAAALALVVAALQEPR